MPLTLPNAIEPAIYRAIYPDLAAMSDTELLLHYERHGKEEGRTPNRLRSREDFVGLMDQSDRILEIGPFANPLTSGERVFYADFLSKADLVNRALEIGIDSTHIPNIDYILSDRPLSDITDQFDYVVSSHCIEHQPDLVRHLRDVQRLLMSRGGKYFLLVPDKRYCFDRFMPLSTIADVLESFECRRTVHSVKSVIEHRTMMTHNDAGRHWNEKSTDLPTLDAKHLLGALTEFRNSDGRYIDVHAWYFTPDSFVAIMSLLNDMGMIALKVEKIYDTRFGSNEFWAVLELE